MKRILLTVLLMVVLAGCGKNPKESIVGKWKESDGTETIEFFKDGTVVLIKDGMSIAGNYTFLDDNRIKMELGGLGALIGPVVSEISFPGSELVMTMSDGKIETYRKWGKDDELQETEKKETKSKYAGKYITDDPGEYIELNKDGTFVIKHGRLGGDLEQKGTWKIENDRILFIQSWLPPGYEVIKKAQISDNQITEKDGKCWKLSDSKISSSLIEKDAKVPPADTKLVEDAHK